MKKSQLTDIKKMDAKAVLERVKQVKLELQRLELDKSLGKLTDIRTIGKKRKDVARMLTVLNQKLMLAEMEGQNA